MFSRSVFWLRRQSLQDRSDYGAKQKWANVSERECTPPAPATKPSSGSPVKRDAKKKRSTQKMMPGRRTATHLRPRGPEQGCDPQLLNGEFVFALFFGSPVRLRTSDPLVNRSPVKSFVFNVDISLRALGKALHDSRYQVSAPSTFGLRPAARSNADYLRFGPLSTVNRIPPTSTGTPVQNLHRISTLIAFNSNF